ncbi:hypothetical protein, partial [Aggregatibacter actinomycetemcomitans]|uniref:hypothetical protein n=1 Tax=Aggregatibacter actinomycetemcomitans TaxID=714 RepID=UPI00197B878D
SSFRAFAFLFRAFASLVLSLLTFSYTALPYPSPKNKPQTNFLPSQLSPELQSFFFSLSYL